MLLFRLVKREVNVTSDNDKMPNDPDQSVCLDFVGTERLVEELRKRFDAGVVIMEGPAPHLQNRTLIRRRHWGGTSRALGMVALFNDMVMSFEAMRAMDAIAELEEDDEDDLGG